MFRMRRSETALYSQSGSLKAMADQAQNLALPDAAIWNAWGLMCVAEADRLGFTPLASSQIHVLLYLANTLAPLFKVIRVRGRVLKRGPYPFYPEVQRELDRMAFRGVFSIDKVDFGPRGHLAAHYSLGIQGRRIYTELVSHSAEARRTANLFAELACACFGKFLETESAIGPIDANYGNDDVLEGEVVDFSEWQDENKNMRVARYLMDQLRLLQPNPQRDGVRLYCEYLDKALELHE